MIDVIIPAYNNHSTIEQSLCSLVMQVNKDELQVIISNDGGEDYSEVIKIFSRWLNIKEIKCPVNRGPGFARNYALDNSDSEYIVFMDADDTFTSSYAILAMKKAMDENPHICFLIGSIAEYEKDTETGLWGITEMRPNLMFLFGHIYRRSFLDKYKIRFQTACFNEDVGFNGLCASYAGHEHVNEGVAFYGGPPLYTWTWSPTSFSRTRGDLYKKQLCIPGYTYNHLELFKRLEEDDFPIGEYLWNLMVVLFTLYSQHQLILGEKCSPIVAFYTEELNRQYFYKYYHTIKQLVQPEVFEKCFKDRMDEVDPEERAQFKMTFEEFVELMFSKPPRYDLDYLKVEQDFLHDRLEE